DLVVVAPYLCEPLAELVAEGRARWLPREYATGDLDGAWLIHTATGDRHVDDRVAAEAQAARIWCIRAYGARASAAWTPAAARIGDVLVAVTRARPAAGSVALVGVGPGDPGLITTRGRQLLAEADVVVVDRLAPRALLAELDPDVEVIDVGKTPGHHPVSQDEINRLLVE